MEILAAKNITKRFGSCTAIDNISFSLQKEEILGFLGPNGAGKTTTIQILLGILTPTSGEVFYFGKDLRHHRSEIVEHVNFSSAYTNLPWNLTVYENLVYVTYLYDIKNRKEKVAEIARTFDLERLMNVFTGNLSAGELTRLNLAKASLNNPKVLLLDEPTASLDPDVAQYIRKLLLTAQERAGVSIIFTSHNMAEVEEVCDRIIFIDRGKIIADDTPANLARSIKTARVTFMVSRDLEKAADFIAAAGFSFRIERSLITVEVPDTMIATLLQDMSRAEISYYEISIEKPRLEDYFLKVAHREYPKTF